MIGFEAGSAVREVIDVAVKAAGERLDAIMELRSIEGIKHMVSAGIGIGFVSQFALRAGEGLACRDGRLARKLAVVHRSDRAPSPAAREFEKLLSRAGWRPSPRSGLHQARLSSD
jgi:DNA-binding transcriptional LysR family regulator